MIGGMMTSQTDTFEQVAKRAFPAALCSEAYGAAQFLLPYINQDYRQPPIEVVISGKIIKIPRRLYFPDPKQIKIGWLTSNKGLIQCLLSRSSDGYKRQEAIRQVIKISEPWAVPYIVLLSGEYVVEINAALVVALPVLDQPLFINFVLENRVLMRFLKAKATSYWDCYYRQQFPTKNTYPGLQFLHQLEKWVDSAGGHVPDSA